jgi:cell division protein FtsQ
LAALRPVAIAVLVAGLVGFVGWALFFSSWLAVEDVSVEGTRTLANREVVAAAGIDPGTPLVRVDLDEVADRVEKLPAVAEASVHRSWPHTVGITVTERRPLAAIQRSGVWWVMDAEGVVFRETGQRDATLPIISTPNRLGDQALAEVAAVVADMPEDILAQTTLVHAETMDSITLQLRGEREVVWGSAAESDRKAEVLRVLLRQQARVYDVSVPEQPTTST